jgi:hypothetical protein
MSRDSGVGSNVPATLAHALARWIREGEAAPLARWVKRELDSDGAPIHLPIPQWGDCVAAVMDARRQRDGLPEFCQGPLAKLIESARRFSRPDGSFATEMNLGEPAAEGAEAPRAGASAETGPKPPAQRRRKKPGDAATAWASLHPSSFILHPSRDAPTAWASPDRVLASLRDDGAATADFLALDHRDPTASCRFELFGAGRSWLGPTWATDAVSGSVSRPRPHPWVSTARCDLVEWTYRSNPARLTQTALLLRGRRLALLAVLAEFPGSAPRPSVQLRVSRPGAIGPVPIDRTRALRLTAHGKRGSAQVLPIGLPCLAYPTERGAFCAEGGHLVLTHACAGRRIWLPLLISWDAKRHQKAPQWRVLTVSERSQAVAPDRAFAARVSWGRSESYVIYRSLGPPGTRAFLGHQTRARFLVGLFTPKGDVEPIVTVE